VPGDEPVLLDLRSARGAAGPSTIRHASTHAPVDVLAAFDGLDCLPAMSPSSFVLREAF
jgi:erythromycin esterase